MADEREISNKLSWSVAGQQAAIAANKQVADSMKPVADQANAATIALAKTQQLAITSAGTLNQALSSETLNYKALADAAQAAQMRSEAAFDAQEAVATQAATKAREAVAQLEAENVAAQKLTSSIHDIGLQLDALPNPDIGAFEGEGGVSSSGGGISGQKIGSRIAGLGSIVGQSAGGAAFRDVSQLVQLGTTTGVAGVAVGVLAIGLKIVSGNAEEAAKNIQASAKAYSDVAEKALTSTRQQLESERDALILRVKLNQEFADQANAAVAKYAQQPGFGALNLALDGTFKGLQGSADAANDKLKETQNQLNGYNIVLAGNSTATADLTEIEKELLKTREALATAAISQLDEEANTRVRLAALRRSGSVDQINAELDANKDRETIIRNYLLPGVALLGLGADAAKKRTNELNLELQNLTGTDKLLVDAVLPVVAQREAEVNLLKAQKDASDALNPILQDINKAEVDLGQARDKVTAATQAVGQAETDHASKLIDIQETYNEAAASALQKHNDQLAKIDANAAQRTLEQRENLNLQIEGLVGRGQIAEAQAAIRAQRLKETQDARQVQTQKDDAQKTYSDQLKAADQQHDKLLKSEQERYSKELQQRREAYDQAVRDQQFLNNRIKSLRDQEQIYTRSWISAQVTALYKVQDATGNFVANMQSYADRINANIQSGGAAWHPAPSGSSGTPRPGEVVGLPAVTGTAAGSGGRATPTAFDTPSFNRYPGLYISRVPEYHIPVADFNRMGRMGGPSLTFNVGEGGAELAQKIVSALKPVLEQHGERVKVEVVQDLTVRNNNVKKGGRR